MNEIAMRLRSRGSGPGSARDRARAAASAFPRRADGAGLVDVAYGIVESPLGELVAAVTRRGLVTLSYGVDDLDRMLDDLSARVSPRVLEIPARLDPIRRELDEYFEGRRTRFDLRLDLTLATRFGRRVLQAAKAIPYGEVATYRDVATGAGNPAAVRATGTALGRNPVPIVIPCHRVVRTGGGLGGYTGGLHRKEALLELERGERA